MDKEVYENLKYIRKSLSGQLRGKYPYHNVPLRAKWEAPGLAYVYNTETGESSWGKGDSQHLRYAIITLLYDQIPQAIRTREYLKAAAEALRMMESSNPPDWVMWALVAWATSIFWLPILVFLLK